MFGLDCVVISLYVDDFFFCTHIEAIMKTKNFLSTKFEITNLGEVDVMLRFKVAKSDNGFSLNQSHYIENFDVIPVKTPFDPSIQLKRNEGKSVSQSEYAKIIGSVMFLMNHTWIDFAYVVSRLNRYTHNPSSEHWNALERLHKYLKGVAHSTMESVFIALDLVRQEVEWLKNLLAEIPL
ncbi:Retrovirus-related Pol polyprotein from transposon TNT 1-94 [Gossypium australe]|uniref:Retrovirus-related Pol polyprotein from transposon TNT 1-94 n=1 Tax=Gossypium australe TaxID=47621 RepID=A0A5B6WQ48_9ROSI|nr:Retrovirus-related Pol polyprotein from transposon TNT 1-94 [Gossypium australe]